LPPMYGGCAQTMGNRASRICAAQMSRIWVAGHQGMVGSALVRAIEKRGEDQLALATREELDLTNLAETWTWLSAHPADLIILAAGKVGGIKANMAAPGDFIRENLQIQMNVIEAARLTGVRRLIFLGSSCMYPRYVIQPLTEEQLMSGWLEPTNESYAMAKLAGMQMCRAYSQQYKVLYQTIIPCNLYGPGENADPETCHVIPAIAAQILEAKRTGAAEIRHLGTGFAKREWMHVDDAAMGILHTISSYQAIDPINLGSGEEYSINGLINILASVIGWKGEAIAAGGEDGMPRKLLNSFKARKLGWMPKIELREGLKMIYGSKNE
jgi:GDP-L-fucose synthase